MRPGKRGITTKRNRSNSAYLLQFFQGRCINTSFLKVNNTRADNFLNDALVNFTLFIRTITRITSHTPVSVRLKRKRRRGARRDEKERGGTLTTSWFDISLLITAAGGLMRGRVSFFLEGGVRGCAGWIVTDGSFWTERYCES